MPGEMTTDEVDMQLRRGNAATKSDLMKALRWLRARYKELGEMHSMLSQKCVEHQEKADAHEAIAKNQRDMFLDVCRQRDLAVMMAVEMYEKVLATPEAPKFADMLRVFKSDLDTAKKRASPYDAIIKALEFYADPETYFAIGFFPDPPCGPFMEDFSKTEELGNKPGKMAREALALLSPADRESAFDTNTEGQTIEHDPETGKSIVKQDGKVIGEQG